MALAAVPVITTAEALYAGASTVTIIAEPLVCKFCQDIQIGLAALRLVYNRPIPVQSIMG
jgi:hypothetical protein